MCFISDGENRLANYECREDLDALHEAEQPIRATFNSGKMVAWLPEFRRAMRLGALATSNNVEHPRFPSPSAIL
jgi:hypothetical protein